MKGLREFLHNKRTRHILYAVVVAGLVLWVIYRFVAIGMANNMQIFNAARDANLNGVPVNVMIASNGDGVLREPIMINNNRGYVAASRIGKFAAGQKIGNGVITSVASRIDLDSGMYVVRTRGVENGLQFAEYKTNGIFVPVHAIENDTVMVVRNGVARAAHVKIARQDADNALIKSGLASGDLIVLGNVADGIKVKIQK